MSSTAALTRASTSAGVSAPGMDQRSMRLPKSAMASGAERAMSPQVRPSQSPTQISRRPGQRWRGRPWEWQMAVAVARVR